MKVLENLEPKSVMKYFEEISQIPRGSKNEKEITKVKSTNSTFFKIFILGLSFYYKIYKFIWNNNLFN